MHTTKNYNMPPKDISNKLLGLHERKPFPYTTELKIYGLMLRIRIIGFT